MFIHLESRRLRLKDAGTGTLWSMRDLPVSRLGVSLVTSFMRINIKECYLPMWNKSSGVHGTNPLKVKKKVKTTSKLSDVNNLPKFKVHKKPAIVELSFRCLHETCPLRAF